MMVRLAKPPFSKPDWLYEVKWDGIRLMAYIDSQRVRLVTRRGRNATSQFPELMALPSELLGVESAILDGELVACDAEGKPDFVRLQQRVRTTSSQHVRSLSREIPVCLVAFDLLYLNGEDLRPLPLVERKARLREAVQPRMEHVIYCEHRAAAEGEALYHAIWDRELEGVVAKDKASPYVSGRAIGSGSRPRHPLPATSRGTGAASRGDSV